jgi:hypothetical protein
MIAHPYSTTLLEASFSLVQQSSEQKDFLKRQPVSYAVENVDSCAVTDNLCVWVCVCVFSVQAAS